MAELGNRPIDVSSHDEAHWTSQGIQDTGLIHSPFPEHGDDVGGILAPREWHVLQGLADGLTAKKIAWALGISPRTVEHHIARAQAKMRARTGAQAVARAVALGLIQPTQI